MDIMTRPMWTLASAPQGFPEAPRLPEWSLDWEEHASHGSQLEKAVSKIAQGNLQRQQAAHTAEEAIVRSRCSLGPHGERAQSA